MFNWLIKLLGGKTKSEYEDMQKELNEKCAKLSSTLDSYANLDFVASGEYSFSVKANSPYSILVKKGQSLIITGYNKDGELLEKINITTEPEEARLIALIVLDFIEKKPCFFDPRNDILNKLNKIGWGKRTSLIVININEMILPR